MRKILLSIILLTTFTGTIKAQTDYCKDIKKYGPTYVTPLPTWKAADPAIQIGFGKNGSVLQIGLTAKAPGTGTTTDISIVFEDGSKLEYTNLTLIPLPGSAGTTVFYTASNSEMDKFRATKVQSFTMMGVTTAPFADSYKDKVMGFANCPFFASDPANTAVSTALNAPRPAGPEKKSIEGFWGIKFGASVADVKTAIAAKGGKLSVADSKPDMLLFDNVVFTQRKTNFITAKFVDGKFYEAVVVYPAPEEVQLLSSFTTTVSELTNVYGDPELVKKFEYPYTEGDGHEVLAITSGKATYGAVWTTNNGNTISVEIKKSGNIYIFYTDTTLEKSKDAKKSADY